MKHNGDPGLWVYLALRNGAHRGRRTVPADPGFALISIAVLGAIFCVLRWLLTFFGAQSIATTIVWMGGLSFGLCTITSVFQAPLTTTIFAALAFLCAISLPVLFFAWTQTL